MSKRSDAAAAMKARLRQFSQAPTDINGPLPGLSDGRTANAANVREETTSEVSLAFGAIFDRVENRATAPRRWRSQGITIYAEDDARLEQLALFFKARGIKFGRRGQISLLAGAGIAALQQLLKTDPTMLLTIVDATIREREKNPAP